jgi:hypothetical protein
MFYFRLLLLFLSLLLTACSSTRVTDTVFNDHIPITKVSAITEALECAKEKMEKRHYNKNNFVPTGYIYVLSDITDGTLNPHSSVDGDLSDGEKMELANSLLSVVDMSQGVILNNFPPLFDKDKQLSPVVDAKKNTIQIKDEYSGEINADILKNLSRKYTERMNNSRTYLNESLLKRKENKPLFPMYENATPLVVNATFTRNDSEPFVTTGTTLGGGLSYTQSTVNDLALGNNKKTKGVTLVITISNPQTNQILLSKAFTAYSFADENTFKIKLGYAGTYVSLDHADKIVQPTHAIQQALIDTVALWLVNETYGVTNSMNLQECLPAEARHLIRKNF